MLAGQLDPQRINAVHFASLVGAWKARYTPSTTWQKTCYLRLLADAIGTVAGIHDLRKQVPKLHPPRPRTVILTPEQISTLFANAPPWFRVFLTLTTALGLRHSEALDVRPANYDAAAQTVSFIAKGGERQSMPCTEEVAALFSNAPIPPGGIDPLTPLIEIYKGAKVNRNSTWWEWRKIKRHAGLPDNITPHDLRRTLAVTGYELTKDLRFVWQILRHKNLSTTARYLEHVDTANIRPLLQQLWTPKTKVIQ